MTCPDDFAVGVTVLEVNHSPAAERVIIKYYLNRSTSNPDSPGWVYIESACGYRGICDDEWICMTPNTQHPLHSNVIKGAGIYYYVWDYNGEFGLNPSAFDGDHSFIVQLALQDTGCIWIDPCVAAPNLVPSGPSLGLPVLGDLDTQGNCADGWHIELDSRGCPICVEDPPDEIVCSNTVPSGLYMGNLVEGFVGTSGNCGVGWHIELDINGCPYCAPDPIEPGGGGGPGTPVPPGTGEPPEPTGEPPTNDPPDRDDGGGGGGGGEPEPPTNTDPTDPGDGAVVGPTGTTDLPEEELNISAAGDSFSNGSDKPIESTSPGEGIHDVYYEGQELTNINQQNILGASEDQWLYQAPDDGTNTYTSPSTQPKKPSSKIVGDPHGGKAPHLEGIYRYENNRLYSPIVDEFVNPGNTVPNDKEIGITTRSFDTENGAILNEVPGTAPKSGPSKIEDGVTVEGDKVYIKQTRSFRTEGSLIKSDSSTTQSPIFKVNETDSLRKNVKTTYADRTLNSDSEAELRKYGSENRANTVGSHSQGATISSRNPKDYTFDLDTDFVKHLTLYKNDPTFIQNNGANLRLSQSGVNLGSRVHVSAFTYPLIEVAQILKLALYTKDADNIVRKVASTQLLSAKGARRIALNISTSDMAIGTSKVIMVVTDENNEILYVKSEDLSIRDPNAKVGIPDNRQENNITGVSKDWAGALFVTEKTVLTRSYLSSGPSQLFIVLNKEDSAPVNPSCGVRTRDPRDSRRQHTLSLWDEDIALDIDDLIISGTKFATSVQGQVSSEYDARVSQYSASVYKKFTQAEYPGSDIVILRITNVNTSTISTLDIEVGGDLRIRPTSISSKVDNGDGTYTVTFSTQYAFADLDVFLSGGNNIVPLTISKQKFTTDSTGAGSVTFEAKSDDWFGLALHQPSSISTSARAFFYDQI